MIRTVAVELKEYDAIAYKHKIIQGGAGITIIRNGKKGTASIDKRTLTCTEYTKAPGITIEMYNEAVRLTQGLPYKDLNPLNAKHVSRKYKMKQNEAKKVEYEKEREKKKVEYEKEREKKKLYLRESLKEEYSKIVAEYIDNNGDFSYKLLNRDFIKFANSSRIINQMIEEAISAEDILNYLVSAKIKSITNRILYTEEELKVLTEMIEEAYPRSAFKECKDYIKSRLGVSKRIIREEKII